MNPRIKALSKRVTRLAFLNISLATATCFDYNSPGWGEKKKKKSRAKKQDFLLEHNKVPSKVAKELTESDSPRRCPLFAFCVAATLIVVPDVDV